LLVLFEENMYVKHEKDYFYFVFAKINSAISPQDIKSTKINSAIINSE